MVHVATLIAHPDNPVLDQHIAARAASAVGSNQLYWLADGIACDIPLPTEIDIALAKSRIGQIIVGAPIDQTVQRTETRRKKALIADMDSTMIDQECIDELAATIGKKHIVADITARAMNGELEFEPALRERVAMLKGIEATVVERIISEKITLASGGRTLVKTMRANGARTVLVSGGFTCFSEKVAAMLGFDENRANTLLQEGGYFTGNVAEPILGSDAKVSALKEAAARCGISTDQCLAVGDGANDLAMLKLAGSGVALHAKPSVAESATHRIDHGDLTALLYMQGYRKSDFAE